MMFYSIFQIVIMAIAFAYATKFIEEKTNNKIITVLSLAFYAVFPLNPIFALSTTKDTLLQVFHWSVLYNYINLLKKRTLK